MSDLSVEQTSIPVPETHPIQLCAWCGDLAIEELTLEKERHRYVDKGGKKIKQIAHRAVTAWVCQRHRDILKRNNPALNVGKDEDMIKHKPNWLGWGKQSE